MCRCSRDHVLRIAEMPADDLDEGRVALSRPDGGEMTDEPDRGAGDSEAEAKPDCRSERAIDDRDGPRRAAEQDRFGQRAMDRGIVSCNGFGLVHQTSAPPPN
jgi:hypothetical protein